MNLSIFALLWALRKKNLPDGALTLIYLGLYSSIRFFITFTNSYPILLLGLNQAQWISIVVFLVSIPLLISMHMKERQSRSIR